MRKEARLIDPPPPRHKSKKARDFCKHSPDHEHAFAEHLLTWSHITHDGFRRSQFILCCVYCQQKAWYQNIPYHHLVKWTTTRLATGERTNDND